MFCTLEVTNYKYNVLLATWFFLTCSSVECDAYTAKWTPANSSISHRRPELSKSDPEFKAVIQNMDQMGGKKYTRKVDKVGEKN